MPRRKNRPARRRRPRRGPQDDQGRHEQLRWQRQARDFIAAFEPQSADDEKLRRLLISLAEFLEPARSGRLGAEGVWGVFRAFREIAEQGTARKSSTRGEPS